MRSLWVISMVEKTKTISDGGLKVKSAGLLLTLSRSYDIMILWHLTVFVTYFTRLNSIIQHMCTLYYFILYCTILYCIMLFYIVSYCIISYHIVLYYIVLYCTILSPGRPGDRLAPPGGRLAPPGGRPAARCRGIWGRPRSPARGPRGRAPQVA